MTTPAAWLPTVAEIDLGALTHNIHAIRARLTTHCQLMAVVKANAYGHGAGPLARVALQHGATWLGVARCQEGITLRHEGITAPLLVLGTTWPEELPALLQHCLTPVIGSPEDATHLQQAAHRRGQVASVHVKIDTGMGRFGVMPEHVTALLDHLQTCPNVRIEGLMTHLACADTPDVASVQLQLTRFRTVLQQCTTRGLTPPYIHAANSAGLYRYPESHGTLARAGIVLYGAPAFVAPAIECLRPVLTWKTHLARLQTLPAGAGIGYGHTFVTRRASVIGTLPVGYADGFNRQLSNGGQVLIRGQRVSIVGQVCMDMCMVDLTDLPAAQVGDEVVLIGAQGQERLTAEDMAVRCGTIPYEILCGISQRVPRRYLEVEPTLCP
jgi:alanine racemase